MTTQSTAATLTPEATLGLTAARVEALRYDNQPLDERESTGQICRLIPEGARVLDVGCGTGSISRFIRDTRKTTVVGIEPNAERAKLARERGIDVHVGILDAESAATLGKFDAIVFADVLEHLSDPAPTLAMAASILNPGGAVLASTPNVAHWTVRYNLLFGRFDYQATGIMDATHLRWFTRESFQGLFAAVGLRVDTYLAAAGLWMTEYRTMRPWRWMRPEQRDKLVMSCLRRWPALFGCQHVVHAVAAK